MMNGDLKLQQKIVGRAEMCLRTARVHPDPQVRYDNRIRAEAYLNAAEDVRTAIEEGDLRCYKVSE